MGLAVERWRWHTGPALPRWLTVVAEMEALAALAGYAYENPDDVFPELVADGPLFDAAGLGHPLLPADVAVRNDVTLNKERRLLIVSGSNMSGKSTFLRTIGVNGVLALAGAPVRATRLRLSPLAVGASLRNQDSLQAGRSRFYTEITRLKQIVELARGPLPVLFLLDEILHGTNSHDRRIGAEAVIRTLLEERSLGLVTTHDLALAEIAEQLGPIAANVHFADELVNGALHFDYRLHAGVVQHSNALALMRAVGLCIEDAGSQQPGRDGEPP
jgi:DNA mismatch repair ATPase MutS